MSAKIFVGNLNFQTTRDSLAMLFSSAGEVVDIYMPMDRMTGRPRGFAFVEFNNEEAANEAIEKFDGEDLDGRPIRINLAKDRPRSPGFSPPSFGGGGGGFGGGGGGGGHRGGGGGAGGRPAKPKGSRRGKRAQKRSL